MNSAKMGRINSPSFLTLKKADNYRDFRELEEFDLFIVVVFEEGVFPLSSMSIFSLTGTRLFLSSSMLFF